MERLLVVLVTDFLHEAPDGSTLREYAALLDALLVLCPFSEPVRLGLYALPVRGPSRFFGGERAVLAAVTATVHDVVGREARLGVADGLFCAELAAAAHLVVPPGATTSFRRSQPIEVLGRADLASTARRLGLSTVGAFADLDAARVAERFNKHALYLQRVARGELSELDTQRDAAFVRRLARLRGEEQRRDEQIGFFGQRGALDERAEAAVHRVRRRLGADAVKVAALRGGRGPEDRASLLAWGAPEAPRRDEAPWPGRLEAPSPATTFTHPIEVELRDAFARVVALDGRGLLSEVPEALWFSRERRHTVVWHAGPWPSVERWWSRPRRRAHLQVLLDTGQALLLVVESGRWWLVGVYD